MTKQCSTCGEIKEIELFHKKETSADGYNNHCKVCILNRRRELSNEVYGKPIEINGQFRKRKVCPICGLLVSKDEFTKNNTRKDGMGAYCKRCFNEKYSKDRTEYHKEYYKKNKDKILKDSKDYHELNKDKSNKRKRKHYKKYKEEYYARCRRYRRKNEQKYKDYMREYYQKNKEKMKEQRVTNQAKSVISKFSGNEYEAI